MNTYQKIQSIYLRDPETKYKTLLDGQYSLPEFKYLEKNNWIWTEKVNGTNIRVMWNGIDKHINFGGKADQSQVPVKLINVLRNLFSGSKRLFEDKFKDMPVCFYGEGYGAGIQKGGGNYSSNQDFVLFDIKIGHWWLKRKDVEDLAEQFNLKVVPIFGKGTLRDAVFFVKQGFYSDWGKFQAEGLVLRPEIELKARSGARIITKIKYEDFPREEN